MIIGHKKQRQFLEQMIRSGRLPHALLFSGQEKLGKKTIALDLISLLFGENPKNHPDFISIEPITKQIQIDQIRNLSWRLALKPIKAQSLAVIIDQAHLMTKEAQNCFLKTLEEPRGPSLLILITEYPNFLLPTILSRCQIIKFYPVKKEEIREYLGEKGILKEKIEEISEISLGRLGIAIEFLENPGKLKEREARIKDLIKISNSPISLRFQYARDLFNRDNLREVLNTWLFFFRNILFSKLNKSSSQRAPAALVNYYSLGKLKNILRQIQKIFFLISTTNVNQRLALEILMLEL